MNTWQAEDSVIIQAKVHLFAIAPCKISHLISSARQETMLFLFRRR
ncbi:MAG: hypothetical protein AAF298_22970 [Cyanobacteria bacterium P01_A01_bin.40]